MLYPAELRDLYSKKNISKMPHKRKHLWNILFCRGGRIRTCDLLVPNQARWPDYATPRIYQSLLKRCGETGTRTQATVTRRQISNLLRYHSGTSPILKAPLLLRLQMYNNFLFCTNILEIFLYIFYQSNNYQILKNSKIFFISVYLGGKTIP